MNQEQSRVSLSEELSNTIQQSFQYEDWSGLLSIKGISLDAVLGEEMLPRQIDNLKRAQSEYSLGRYDEARSILEKIPKSLQSALVKSVPESVDWEQSVRLAASTFTLLGRTYERLGMSDESVRASHLAVELFDTLKASKPLSNVEMNEFGIALQLAGRIEESIELLKEAANLGSATSEAYFYLGMDAFRHKDYQKAETYLNRASDLEPDDLQVTRLETLEKILSAQGFGQPDRTIAIYSELSEHLIRLARLEDALTVLDRILELEPDNLRAYLNKCIVLSSIDRKEEALVTLQHGLTLEPGNTYYNAVLLASQGTVLFQLGRYGEAVAAFDQAEALDLDDLSGLVLSYKGRALVQLKRYEEALTVLDQALQLDPNNAETLGYKGRALVQLKRYEEALTVLDQALQLDPNNAEMLGNKGRALVQLKRYEEALTVLDQALQLDPNNTETLGYKGWALSQLERYEDALNTLDRGIEIDSKQVWLLTGKGEVLRWLGRKDEALEVQDQVLAQEPNNVIALSVKGNTLIELNREQEAIYALDNALSVDSKDTTAMAAKAWALMRLDDYNGARATIRSVLELKQDYAWARGLYGTLLSDIADYEQAIYEMEETTKLDSSLGWVFDYLGEACARLAQQKQDMFKAKGLIRQAIDAYTHALDLDKENLALQARLADAVLSLGEEEEDRAYDNYLHVIELSKKRASLDFRETEAVGWCHFRLANMSEAEKESRLTKAERLLVESLALRKDKPDRYDVIITKFRLALVILYSGRYQLAFSEYENSLSIVKEKQIVIQHGIIDRARKDMQEAMREYTPLTSASNAKRIQTTLQKEYDRTLTAHRD